MRIEVNSPSNRHGEWDDKAMMTLAGEGAIEFWMADTKTRTVKVYSKSVGVRIYDGDACVPVPVLDLQLPLTEIFAE